MTVVDADPARLAQAAPGATARHHGAGPGARRRRLAFAAAAAVAAVAVALRFWPAGPLWLDEAQSVAIARLPVPHLIAALRQDGSPPMYYLLLHGWMAVFGSGTWAVRALSGLFGVAAIPLAGVLARRLLGSRVVVPATTLLAASPFAIRYSVETRMYSLVVLLVLVAGIALAAVLERPTAGRLAGWSASVAALLLTHYWALFLLSATVAVLAWRVARGSRAAGWGLLGAAAGTLPFLPWLPDFVYQAQHTGTPWFHAPWYGALQAILVWAGADRFTARSLAPAVALMPVLFALVVLAARRRSRVRELLAVTAVTLAVGGLVSTVARAAVVARYTSVALVPYLLSAGAGIALLRLRARRAALAVVVTLGFLAGYATTTQPRTLAATVAERMQAYGRPADSVVYCPDQLGPDVSRLLTGWRRQQVFPTGTAPARVDWVNYDRRNLAASPARYARRVVASARHRPLWLVLGERFPGYHGRCRELDAALRRLRPDNHVLMSGANPMNTDQPETLTVFDPPSPPPRATVRRHDKLIVR